MIFLKISRGRDNTHLHTVKTVYGNTLLVRVYVVSAFVFTSRLRSKAARGIYSLV